MDELINYLKKTFDEPTLKVINFMEKAKILNQEMQKKTTIEDDKKVTKTSTHIVETSYLRLCDENPDFKHDMMGEIYLYYLGCFLREVSANWKFDIENLEHDLSTKCGYCNIKLKFCPMKVLAYIKKCAKDEKINEKALFDKLMNNEKKYKENRIEEANIADKVLYLCKNPVDLQGAEFLLDTESVKIVSDEYRKLTYKVMDFEVKKVSLINNIYSFFVEDSGITGEIDIASAEIKGGYSYMFDKSPVELAVYTKYLCDKAEVDYYNVFEIVYKKLGKVENVTNVAYYNEYIRKIDKTLDVSEKLQQELKDTLTYIRNYDKNAKLPYVKFDFLIYTKNSKVIDNVASILNKYCRNYNYLSNKNMMFVDMPMFIERTKDCYDVIMQIDKMYANNDFIIFTNIDKATGINDYRLDSFFTMVSKVYNRDMKSITIFTRCKSRNRKII